MKVQILALLAMLFLGVAFAAQIDPGEDELMVNSDGEIIEIFGIDPWLSDTVSFPNPVEMQNGTAVIGGVRRG
jgi:hypothetical protein